MDHIMGLIDKLKNYRAQKAVVEKVSHASIFSNETLRQMATKRPINKESLQVIKGIDEMKASKYGEDLLKMIKQNVLKSIRTTTAVAIPTCSTSRPNTPKVVIVNSGTCSLDKTKKRKMCTTNNNTTAKAKKTRSKPEKTLKSIKKVTAPVSNTCTNTYTNTNTKTKTKINTNTNTNTNIPTLPPQPKTNVYILQLEDNKVYVGKSTDVSRRMQEHNNHEGSVFTKRYKPICELPRLGNIQGVGDAMERDETLKYMYMRGIENVRGWKYVNITLSKHEIDEAESNIREMFDLCRKCGIAGHFVRHCNNKVDRLGRRI